MKKYFFLFSTMFLLNGCVESVAFLGSSFGGASSGRMVQSTIQSTLSYGIKKQTGKTPLGHALAYAEKNNPEKKRERCISFIEKTRSEFCTIAKKKVSLTSKAIKEKVEQTVKKNSDNKKTVPAETIIKLKNEATPKVSNYLNSFNQFKKSPRELALAYQTKMKNLKEKLSEKYLVSR